MTRDAAMYIAEIKVVFMWLYGQIVKMIRVICTIEPKNIYPGIYTSMERNIVKSVDRRHQHSNIILLSFYS